MYRKCYCDYHGVGVALARKSVVSDVQMKEKQQLVYAYYTKSCAHHTE